MDETQAAAPLLGGAFLQPADSGPQVGNGIAWRDELEGRMRAIADQNAQTQRDIAALDAQRSQLATISQQQAGAYNALADLLKLIDG